jgi:hypothetical protein
MSFGMEIFSADGVLQADANLFGYFCRKSATVTSIADPGFGWTSPSVFIVPKTTYTYPLFAFRSNGHRIARVTTQDGDHVFASSAPIGTTLDYFAFDWAPTLPAPASGFGIEMRNDAGQRTFVSDQFPMRVAALMTTGSQTFTGKTMAVALPRTGAYRTAGPIRYNKGGVEVLRPEGEPWDFPADYDETFYDQESDLYGGSVTNSGQTVNFELVSFNNIQIGPEPGDILVLPDFDRPVPILAVDVTGIPLNTTFF